MIRIARLQRTGKSVAVVIPREFQTLLRWTLGDRVAVGVHGDCVVLRRVDEAQLAAHLAEGTDVEPRGGSGV